MFGINSCEECQFSLDWIVHYEKTCVIDHWSVCEEFPLLKWSSYLPLLTHFPISLTFGPNDLGPYFWACRSLIVLPTVVLVIRTMPQTPPQTHTRTQPKTHPNTQTLSQTLPLQSKGVFGVWHSQTQSFSIKKREDDGMLEARLLQESSGASMPQFALGRILNFENFSLWN